MKYEAFYIDNDNALCRRKFIVVSFELTDRR